MMRILMAAPDGDTAGGISRWTKHILTYYKNYSQKECSLCVLSTERPEFTKHASSHLVRVLSGCKDYCKASLALLNKLIDEKYDILHITSSASLGLIKDILFIIVAHIFKVKTVVHFRFGRIPQLLIDNNWETKLLKFVIRLSNSIIVIDKLSYDNLIKFGFKNIYLLPNPVSPDLIKFKEEHPDILREPRFIFFAGHCVLTKGVVELVSACKKINNIRLRLSGIISPEMRELLIDISGNADWLEITGNQTYDKVLEDMLRCDVFVLPTYTEGFPNVILESMALGCPIISTTVGAIPEMLEKEDDKEFGILVPPKSIDELHIAIIKMLSDEIFKEQCGLNAFHRVHSRYSIDTVWSMMQEIWHKTN